MPLPPETLSEQPLAQSPGSESDLLYCVQSGITRRMTRAILRTAIFSTLSSFIRTFLNSSTQDDARTAIGALGASDITDKADLNSPTFTGTPAAPTVALGDNTTRLATMAALRASILGTVVDVGGIPAGTVIEFTTGANGDCLRLADGTQITAKLMTIGSTGFVASGSVFITSASQGGGAYTKPFVGAPKGFVSVRGGSGLVWHTIQTEATATAWPLFFMMSSTNTTTSTSATLICFGRWK